MLSQGCAVCQQGGADGGIRDGEAIGSGDNDFLPGRSGQKFQHRSAAARKNWMARLLSSTACA